MKFISVFIVFLFAAKVSADQQTSQIACGKIEKLLLDSQMRSQEMNEDQFKTIDQNLKNMFVALCEETNSSTDLVIGKTLYYPNGQIATDDITNEEAAWFYPDGSAFYDVEDVLAQIFRKAAPIAGPFASKHKLCAAGCGYVSWGIWGDNAHKKRKSCHNSGEAIDVHAITCGGRTHAARSKRFTTYVNCMGKHFGTIYLKKDHYNHAHIQLRNCRKIKG
jgi:hypothetical protein